LTTLCGREIKINELFEGKSNIFIKGSFDPKYYNLLDSDFYDIMHLTDTGQKKIINAYMK